LLPLFALVVGKSSLLYSERHRTQRNHLKTMANISRAERARREAEKQKLATNEQDQTPPVHEVESGGQDLSQSRDLPLLPEQPVAQAPQADDAGLIPPCPPMSPQLGARTPEVVEWVKQYDPQRFASYYQVKWPHLYGTAE